MCSSDLGCGPGPAAVFPLAGTCLTKTSAPLALAVGVRSNVPATEFPPAVDALLASTANDQQPISLIRIDGQPKMFTLPTFTTTAKNGAAHTQAVNDYLNHYVQPVLRGEIHAQVPQANLLMALSLAASATAPNGNIIVVDSGLQTVAPLAYQHGDVMMAPPGDIVSFLRKEKLLPNLAGRHVLLAGFGYAAAPQPLLDDAQRNNVINQWKAIVTAGGGCVTAYPKGNTARELPHLPPVTVVPPPPPPHFNNCGTIVLSDAGSVGFHVGKDTFRDPAAAQATLRNLAGRLKQGSEHIRLIGSTSSEGGDALNNPLSQQRADAVERVLEAQGIPSARITAIGDGSHWAGRVNDIGPGGVLLPGPAEQDREVIVQLPKCQ